MRTGGTESAQWNQLREKTRFGGKIRTTWVQKRWWVGGTSIHKMHNIVRMTLLSNLAEKIQKLYVMGLSRSCQELNLMFCFQKSQFLSGLEFQDNKNMDIKNWTWGSLYIFPEEYVNLL